MSTTDDLALAPRSVLVHIGPHKTGTTAIQGALDLARDQLLTRGIRYVGRDRGPMRKAISALTNHATRQERGRDLDRWSRLAAEVTSATDERVVISNEFLCEADDEVSRRMINDLGGDRAHVVVTLRPWGELLPSQWQQFVRNGLQTPYDKWLDATLNNTRPSKTAALYWRRHDHAVLVDRWVQVVGTERVTVIASGTSDRNSVLRGFEAMLALDEGFLVPPPTASNRSLTLGEVELVRLLNTEFKARGWGEAHYNALMRHGVIEQLRTAHQPSRDEPRISTPAWALRKASEAAGVAAASIAATGVRVIGDLSSLSAVPTDPAIVRADDESMPDPTVSAEAARQAVVGGILASHATESAAPVAAGGRNGAAGLARRARRRLGRSSAR